MWDQSLGQEDSPGGGHGNPLQYSCLENPMDRGAWQTTVHSITKSQKQLKQVSMQARQGDHLVILFIMNESPSFHSACIFKEEYLTQSFVNWIQYQLDGTFPGKNSNNKNPNI